MKLDQEACYRALQTRDPRFDGQFFTAVLTTKIYCRPICPARIPHRHNCLFLPSAAAAHQAGFRPCLRCRPEIAPILRAQESTLFDRALNAIANGALDDAGVKELAASLEVSDRHLRRLFTDQLGASPATVAQTRRILFAKQLLDETSLSMTEVAMAAGFASIRRFNDTMQKTYQKPPSELRKLTNSINAPAPIILKLPYSPPYDWASLIDFLAGRAMPGIEVVTTESYQRTIVIGQQQGIIAVRPAPTGNCLIANIQFPEIKVLGAIVERLRRIFDLSANTNIIADHLAIDPYLTDAIQAKPGLRVPGAWDGFELAIRAILGQQISVAAATTLASRLVATYGEPLTAEVPWANSELRYIFPRPEQLVGQDLTKLGITKARSKAITSLAAVIIDKPQTLSGSQTLAETVQQLCQLPGIGEWTANYIAMRLMREPDAFPTSDLALLRAMEKHEQPMTKKRLAEIAENWRPWRAYAAIYLWSSL